ncbi:tetratricopeptide repeat-containing protein [Toxoplasma gondii VAND]|uniref:Tetratricopeptide repeat-containing protein n=1 Tax=Toxoplasma gondii VAND TaxID=933077 RepID=A0A086Q8E1_TOXGO|nr:tetratricopeptide repeat-containing protein [Toxoplasma gondii VAND]
MGDEAGDAASLPKMLWKLEALLIFPSETPHLPPSAQKKLFDEATWVWREARNSAGHSGEDVAQGEDNFSFIVEKELATFVQLAADLKRCHYRSVLFGASPLACLLRPLLCCHEADPPSLSALDTALQESCAAFVSSPSSRGASGKGEGENGRNKVDEALLQSLRLRHVLLASVAAAQLFLQVNWTGPPIRAFRPSELLAIQREDEGRARFPDHPFYQRHTESSEAPGVGEERDAPPLQPEGDAKPSPESRMRRGFSPVFSASTACRYCGRCRAAAPGAAADGAERQSHSGAADDARNILCFCETELEAVCCLGPADMPLTPQGRHDALLRVDPTRQNALQRLHGEAMEAFNADGEDVYELVRGLPYLWLACRLAAWLRGHSARLLSASSDSALSCASVFPVFSSFLWSARLAMVSQRILRGVSAAACLAPSLLRVSVEELAAALKAIKVLPSSFSLPRAPEDVRNVLATMGVLTGEGEGHQTARRLLHDATEESRRLLNSLSSSPASSSSCPSSSSSHPLLRYAPKAEEGKERCVLADERATGDEGGDARGLPASEWFTDRQRALMLLELSLHLLMYGKVDASLTEVMDAACEAANIRFSFTGAEGIRRKYQQRAIAQLVVAATPIRPSSSSLPLSSSSSSSSSSPSSASSSPSSSSASASSSSVSASSSDRSPSREDGGLRSAKASEYDSVTSREEGEKRDTEEEKTEEETADAEAEAKRRDWRLQDVHADADVLERPQLVDSVDAQAAERPLDGLEQALLLARGLRILESNPARDELALEQLNAVAVRCLTLKEEEKQGESDHKTQAACSGEAAREAALDAAFLEEENALEIKSADWLLHSAALWLRCKAEYHRSKTVERACLQLNALIDQFNDRLPAPSQRLRFIYHVDYPSSWQGRRELAFRMMHMGATLTAYESFKDLAMWEEAAECLYAADRRADAEELLLERLKVRESPPLWCTLGDLRKSVECYEKAWTLSNKRCARAQRSLGHLYMREENFSKAAEAYARALELNPLHRASWFILGCCEMRLERWEDAVQAFGRVVALEPQDGDAWANLAAVHSQREAWTAARLCIGEAAKYRRESWRVWDNLLKISVRTRDIPGVNEALRHYVDLNVTDRIPIWIYSFLTHAVLGGVSLDASGKGGDVSEQHPLSAGENDQHGSSSVSAGAASSSSSSSSSSDTGEKESLNPGKHVSFRVETESPTSCTARRSPAASPLFKSTLKTLEFLAQNMADQAELWKALSSLQSVKGDFLSAAETRLKHFRALSALLRRVNGPSERGAFGSPKALEQQKEAIDALRAAAHLLQRAVDGDSDPVDIARRMRDINTTACSLTEELRQRANAYDAILQRPQIEALRVEAQELATQTSAFLQNSAEST